MQQDYVGRTIGPLTITTIGAARIQALVDNGMSEDAAILRVVGHECVQMALYKRPQVRMDTDTLLDHLCSFLSAGTQITLAPQAIILGGSDAPITLHVRASEFLTPAAYAALCGQDEEVSA